MKKYLLPKEGTFYKANMHMHTNISDGKMTPEETKKLFMENGYSIVAFTDHEVMVPHPELMDENFIAITSTEIATNERYDCPFVYSKCYHLNIYSKDPNKVNFVGFDKKKMWLSHSLNYIDESIMSPYDRHYSIESMNEIIKKANEDGCFVSYNHPFWSCQNYEDYHGLKGLWGVEWYNNGCVQTGYPDTMGPVDDLLRLGENVFPLATDDAHNVEHCCGGFIMVKALKLEYGIVMDALEKGDFYSSSGPLIEELTIEDGIVNIKTSNAKVIYLTTERRFTKFSIAKEGTINEASFDISKYLEECENPNCKNPYIRLMVFDSEGKCANTRAYRINELK